MKLPILVGAGVVLALLAAFVWPAVGVGKVIVTLFIAVFAFGVGYTGTGKGCGDKAKSYITCVCVTYAVSVLLAEIFGSPVEAGEQVYEWSSQVATRDIPAWSWKKKVEFSHFIFWVSIVPALIGVRCAYKEHASDVSGVNAPPPPISP